MSARTRLLLVLLGLGVALVAQWRLTAPSGAAVGVALYAAACGLFLWGAEARPRPGEDGPLPALRDRRVWALGSAGLAAGVAAAVLFLDNWANPIALVLWVGSVLLFGGAALLADRSAPARPAPKRRLPRRWEWVLLALIVLAALAVRAYQVDLYPNGCQSDECNNGMDALGWLRGLPYMPFRMTNEGQATFFTYILAFFFRLFGASLTTMRLTSALAGACTVLAFYFLARDLYGVEPALLGTALLAGSRWHITFSRIVYEAILTPFFEVLTFYFLLRGLRDRRWGDLVLAGVALGLGLHTYTAFRVIPLVVAAFVALLALSQWPTVRRTAPGLLAGLGATALVVNPLGLYALQHPEQFLARTQHISIFGEVEAMGNWQPLWSNLRKTLEMFHYRGDPAPLHNLPDAPMLGPWAGALVVLGLAYALWRWRRCEHLLYLGWAVGVLALGVLSAAHEAPTSRRTIGLIPLVYLLAAAALERVWHAFRRAWSGRHQAVLGAALAAVTVVSGAGNAYTYFAVQAVDPAVWAGYSPHESAVGRYLASLEEKPRIFLAQSFQRHSAIQFLGREPEYTVLNLAGHLPVRDPDGRDVLYILDPVAEKTLSLFRRFYPQADIQFHRDRYGYLLFISVYVPAEEVEDARGVTGRYYASGEMSPRITRREEQIAFEWTDGAPLEPPFAAEWKGSLLIPAYGSYTFEVRAPGSMTLWLDGLEVARTEESPGVGAGQRTLAGGFHNLKVTAQVEEAGLVQVAMSGSGVGPGPIPAAYLYNLEVPSNGLIGYYRRGTTWDGPPVAIQIDRFIFANDILPPPFSIEWRGKIRVPASGSYVFGTNSDDGSLVYIDGQLVVDNGGMHGLQTRQGHVVLEAGLHDIVVQYFQQDGSREMELWWRPPGGPRELVPLEVLWTGLGEAPEVEISSALAPAIPQAPPPGPALTSLRVQFAGAWGEEGHEPGQFDDPRGVALDGQGHVYVADAGNHRVQKFTLEGELVVAFGEEANLAEPFDLAVGPEGNLFVLDAGKGLARFNADGQFLGWMAEGVNLFHPRGLEADAQGRLYLADTGGARVLNLTQGGQVVGTLCEPGDGEGGVRQPTDVAAAADGTFYVVDPALQLIQRLDAEGRYLYGWTVHGANTYDSPHLALLPSGVLLATDPEGRRVQGYDAQGRVVDSWGAGDWGQFGKPIGIAADRAGNVVVADAPNHRVVRFQVGP